MGKTKKTGREVAVRPVTAESLIAQAIDKKVDVSTIERLVAMATSFKAMAAKERYFIALADFQAECPIIRKKGRVYEKGSTKVRYQFAPLEDIAEVATPILKKFGFAWTVKTTQTPGAVKAIVESHNFGHTEVTEFEVPVEPESYMSAPQKVASALSFAKRYAFIDAFGIVCKREDDDAQSVGITTPNGHAAETPIQQPKRTEADWPVVALMKQIDAALENISLFPAAKKKWLDGAQAASKRNDPKALTAMLASLQAIAKKGKKP